MMSGATEADGVITKAHLLTVLQLLETGLSGTELRRVIEHAEVRQDGLVDVSCWVDSVFGKPASNSDIPKANRNLEDRHDVAVNLQNCLAGIATPARAPQGPPVRTQSVECEILSCPWYDCMAFFLEAVDLEQVNNTCRSLRCEVTISEADGHRKLLLPVAELDEETADAVISRISMPHVRILRIWRRGAFAAIAELVGSGGPSRLKSLERLAFKGCPLVLEDFQQILTPVFACAGGLKHLNLEKSQVTDAMLEVMVSSGAFAAAQPESMNLRFNRITAKGAIALASCPEGFSRMRWVNFKMNQLGDEGALALATMLKQNSSMTMLNLRRQTPPLTDKAASGFAEALRQNSTLEQLRLRRNRIGDAGANVLASALRLRMARLAERFELDLEENRVGVEGGLALLKSLPAENSRIELLLSGNSFDRQALERRVQEVFEDTEVTLNAQDARCCFASKPEGAL